VVLRRNVDRRFGRRQEAGPRGGERQRIECVARRAQQIHRTLEAVGHARRIGSRWHGGYGARLFETVGEGFLIGGDGTGRSQKTDAGGGNQRPHSKILSRAANFWKSYGRFAARAALQWPQFLRRNRRRVMAQSPIR